jgi:predicted alpha/beta hydrolase family esterase
METESLTEKFREYAAALQEIFPKKLDRLVVLVDTSAEAVFLSQKVADVLSGNTGAVRGALNYAFPKKDTRVGVEHNRVGLTETNYSMANSMVTLVALKEDPGGEFSSRWTRKMSRTCYFHHEMGHILVKNGLGEFLSPNLKECAADAFAALRHIQIFGRDTDFFLHYSHAHSVVFGSSASHYTDDALQRVKQLSEETKGIEGKDISKLSLRDTLNLAKKIANEYQTNEITLDNIAKAFSSAKKANGWPAICREVVSVMEKNRNDPEVFEAGKRLLNYPSLKRDMEGWAKTDRSWEKVIDLIRQPSPPIKRAGLKKRALIFLTNQK